ncbi:unnamed protein product, partial [marine sediment metagenome]
MSIGMPYAYMYDQNNQKVGLTNYAHQFFVDGVHGADGNNGRDWAHAFPTIQAALDARGTLYEAEAGDKKYAIIWIKPGVYAEELTGDLDDHNFFACHLIGLGLRGSDSQAQIRPGPGEGSCFTGIANGLHLANLRFEIDEDVPIFDMGIFNNSLIEDCTFAYFNDADGGIGIDTEDCKHLTVRRCSFEHGSEGEFNYGMYFRGGVNKYCHNCRIHDNTIFAQVAGIWIQGAPPCVASLTVIWNNRIIGRQAAFIGIDDNQGDSYVIDNFITALAGDAIDHAGGVG